MSLNQHCDLQLQDSARGQRGKSKKEPAIYNVPKYEVPEDLDAAILGEMDLRDRTNAAHTLPTAFYERFNTLRQQVCNKESVSAAHTLLAALGPSPLFDSRQAAIQPLGLWLALHWYTFL